MIIKHEMKMILYASEYRLSNVSGISYNIISKLNF